MPAIAELRGLWRRSLIAWPDGARDTTTAVSWLQGIEAYIDLRQPAGLPGFSHARGLADLSREDCTKLAAQEGFAGRFLFDGAHFEWARMIDYQPQAVYSDVGSLWWDGDVLIEKGRDIAYIEHWHRDPQLAVAPVAALSLQDAATGARGALLRVGERFMFARDRLVKPAPELTLLECVNAAASTAEAQALVNCEISFGSVSAEGFRITASTLPYRAGDYLQQHFGADMFTTMDRAANGDAVTRDWDIVSTEGELAALRPAGTLQTIQEILL
jgi:hypothetical protein